MKEKRAFRVGDIVKSECCLVSEIVSVCKSTCLKHKWRYGARRKVGTYLGFIDFGYVEDFSKIM